MGLLIASAVVWGLFGLYVAAKVVRSIRLVPNKTELLVERLGRYDRTLGPGIHGMIPFFDRVSFEVDLKERAIEVPPQDCFTRDNVRVEVDGILYMSVMNSKQASYGVTDYEFAAIQLAQTTTRSVIGTLDLDRTFEERDVINSRVIAALNEVSAAWGIKVHRYEVKNIVPPHSVREAMERQMGAERDRRALMARSEGEKQSRINSSEGQKMELINRSEGEKQKRINEAEGRAAEVLALARATAESIEKVGAALSVPGGADAVKLRLAQQFLGKLATVGDARANVVLPVDLLKIEDVLAGLGLDVASMKPSNQPRALESRGPEPVPAPPAAVPAMARVPAVPRMPDVDVDPSKR